jgi:hypothetical protein
LEARVAQTVRIAFRSRQDFVRDMKEFFKATTVLDRDEVCGRHGLDAEEPPATRHEAADH